AQPARSGQGGETARCKMTLQLSTPQLDPAPIFEAFRGNYATELITAAVAHFGFFEKIAAGGLPASELRAAIGLGERQFNVLLTGLKALQLVVEQNGRVQTTPLATEHLLPGQPLDVSDYIRLAADAPGVLSLVEHMRKNTLAGASKDDDRAVFIFRDGLDSA